MSDLTLGSLFDGSGGFPLGGLLSGITPVWASEIEPFPIRVTTKRLPQMKHYGDVSLMDGGEVEPVDIITFGSPCQDMSIAGKREGLRNQNHRIGSLFYFPDQARDQSWRPGGDNTNMRHQTSLLSTG